MHLIRGYHNFNEEHSPCIVTIGNFDGMHIGHQAIIHQMHQLKNKTHLPTVVILFEPHPKEFFQHETLPARLMRLRAKLAALKKYDIDTVLLLKFNKNLASMNAEQFVRQILVDKLQTQYIVAGENFHFGYQREGNFAYLQQISTHYKFFVEPAEMITLKDINQKPRYVSSTWLREALQQHDLSMAKKILGNPYSLCGRVSHGDKRGRHIHTPTANIHLHHSIPPLTGVYAITVHGIRREPLNAVANIGTRPTVDGKKLFLEIHLLEFDENIYGRYLTVKFLKFLRIEQKFENLEALEHQIKLDVKLAKQFFSEEHKT